MNHVRAYKLDTVTKNKVYYFDIDHLIIKFALLTVVYPQNCELSQVMDSNIFFYWIQVTGFETFSFTNYSMNYAIKTMA